MKTAYPAAQRQLDEAVDAATSESLGTANIEIRDVGPIEAIAIPVAPGVTIFRGPNGSGKTTALRAMSRLAGGDEALACRDDATSGCVEGLGVRISVRQSARRTGELEVLSIEGELDIADIVEPEIADPVAADRKRIKALLRLSGAKADVSLFRPLAADDAQFANVCTPDVLKCDDVVEMAARLKRNFESQSRASATVAEKLESQFMAAKQATEGIDLDIETDAALLQAALEDALYAHGDLAGKFRAAEENRSRAKAAEERLLNSPAPNVQEAKAEVEKAATWKALAQRDAAAIEEQLRRERENLKEATAALEAADARLRLEESHANAVKGWRETIEAARGAVCPSQGELDAAQKTVTDSRKAIEQAAVVRAAKEKAAEARKFHDHAKAHRATADGLRDAAHGIDDVLSSAVASDAIKVENGRLVTMQQGRGKVFFADRSDGEKFKIVIDEAIKRIRALDAGKTAIIPIKRRGVWAELDPLHQAEVHRYAVEKRVCVYVAEATAGDLRAEAFTQ